MNVDLLMFAPKSFYRSR